MKKVLVRYITYGFVDHMAPSGGKTTVYKKTEQKIYTVESFRFSPEGDLRLFGENPNVPFAVFARDTWQSIEYL